MNLENFLNTGKVFNHVEELVELGLIRLESDDDNEVIYKDLITNEKYYYVFKHVNGEGFKYERLEKRMS